MLTNIQLTNEKIVQFIQTFLVKLYVYEMFQIKIQLLNKINGNFFLKNENWQKLTLTVFPLA